MCCSHAWGSQFIKSGSVVLQPPLHEPFASFYLQCGQGVSQSNYVFYFFSIFPYFGQLIVKAKIANEGRERGWRYDTQQEHPARTKLAPFQLCLRFACLSFYNTGLLNEIKVVHMHHSTTKMPPISDFQANKHVQSPSVMIN